MQLVSVGAYSLMGAMLGRAYLHIYVFSCLCIIIMEAGSGNPLSMDVWVEGNNWGGSEGGRDGRRLERC